MSSAQKCITITSLTRNLQCLLFSSNRMKQPISHDEYLWEKINMSGNFYENEVPIKFLEFILYRGCKFLNLCKAKLEGNFSLDGMSKLRYLFVKFIKVWVVNCPNLQITPIEIDITHWDFLILIPRLILTRFL